MTELVNQIHYRKRLLLATMFLLGLSTAVQSADEQGDLRHSDMWLKAPLITTYTLNEHLNPLGIDIGIDGIRQVNNELEVQPVEGSA